MQITGVWAGVPGDSDAQVAVTGVWVCLTGRLWEQVKTTGVGAWMPNQW